MLKKKFENGFTFGTFKLFLHKNDFEFLHIIKQRAGKIKNKKTDELGINAPIS